MSPRAIRADRDYVGRVKIDDGFVRRSGASARQPMSPWRHDNHSDVIEKKNFPQEEEGADMRMTEIFSLGRHRGYGDNDRHWYDAGWRNRDYNNQDWRHNWDDRRHNDRGNC
ncbi:MAG: hypothetical protein WCC65_01200 [Pseudonocardiaceae bacterium]